MSFLALAKLPFLLASAFGCYVSYTRPNSKVPKDQRIIKGPDLESLLSSTWLPFIGKAIPCAMFLAESIIIATTLAPPTSISRRILASLAADSDSVNIHLTLPSIIATGFILFGTFVRYSCYKTLGEFFTYEITIRKNHKLVTWGAYSWVRHPSYSGLAAVYVGLALSFLTHGSWVRESNMLSTTWGQVMVGLQLVIISIYIVSLYRRTVIEDTALRKALPAEWNAWAKKVRHKLVPGIF